MPPEMDLSVVVPAYQEAARLGASLDRILGYLAGPKAGAILYNAAHSYLAPMVLITSGFALSSPLVLSVAMIWLAHIGLDRALGFGLKYFAGFSLTHLGRIGKRSI